MNFFDDIRTRVEQSAQSFQGDIKSYIENQIVTPAVKIGQAATGNLSEAEIKAGKKAEAPPIAIADSVSSAVSSVAGAGAKYSPVLLVVLAVGAYFLFFKKGRK